MSQENGTTDSAERRRRVAEEAGEWLLRLQRGDLSKEQRAEFVDWLREAPVHVTEMLRVSQVDAVLREFGGWQDIAPLGPMQSSSSTVVTMGVPQERAEPMRSRARTRWWIPAAIAAGLSVLAVGLWTMSASGWERVETRVAERCELVLVDGSVV